MDSESEITSLLMSRAQQDPIRDRVIFVNPLTQGMIVIEGSSGVDFLLSQLQGKEGQPPASKLSIQGLKEVEFEEGECSICLEVCGPSKEMPCHHRFHAHCIQTWLQIHGSCPICRFNMPVEESDSGKKAGREIWVSFGYASRDHDSMYRG